MLAVLVPVARPILIGRSFQHEVSTTKTTFDYSVQYTPSVSFFKLLYLRFLKTVDG